MKQLLFTLLFILGMYFLKAERIVGVNCPNMLVDVYAGEPGSFPLVDEENGIETFDCIVVDQGAIQFGIELSSNVSIVDENFYSLTYVAYTINGVSDLLPLSNFDENIIDGIYFYTYLLNFDDPLTINSKATFDLLFEVLVEKPNGDLVPFLGDGMFNTYLSPSEIQGFEIENFLSMSTQICLPTYIPLNIPKGFTPNQVVLPLPPKLSSPESKENIIGVAPNPFDNIIEINLASSNSSDVSVKLFNTSGREIADAKRLNRSFSFETNHLSAGFYICKIATPGKEQVFKLVKH